MTDPATIFISYAGPDRPIAERLHRALRDAGLNPWCDAIDLHADETWDEGIPRALGRAHIVAVLISEKWPVAGEQGKGYYGLEEVARAIEHARRSGTRLVPVRLDGVGRERDPFGVFRVAGVEATGRDLGAVVNALRKIIERDAGRAPETRATDPLADAQHLRARRADEGASAKVLAALDARILKLKRGRLHGHKPEAGLALDRWLLVEKCGRGGFAEVWAAEDMHTGAPVALKILHAQFDDSAERRARFFRGAARMAALDHPQIVQVIAPACAAQGRHFFVMELLPGGDLDAAVRQSRLDRRVGIECVVQIAEAVAVAHDVGWVHRDIKPANILLDADGRPKLTDFDLVRTGDTTGGTRTGTLGTFIYAAPEALEDAGRVDHRVDVYGLGMSALFVLLGKPLTRRVLREPEKVLRRVDGFDAVKREILRAIDWEPEERHASARDFAAALREALGPGPRVILREVAPLSNSMAVLHVIPWENRNGAVPGMVVAGPTPQRPALVYVPAGDFVMGSPPSERGRQCDEGPQAVRLTSAFWMAETPVTVAQYRALVGGEVRGDGSRPITEVSWLDAAVYCNALSDAEGLRRVYGDGANAPRLQPAADGYRLPTEAQWEYACRAATITRFWSGDGDAHLAGTGWYEANSEHQLHPVAEKPANPWGLYDMHGNVWEWCQDWRREHPNTNPALVVDPTGQPTGGRRGLRGGSYVDSVDDCRSAQRFASWPGFRLHLIGFRLVRPAPAL